MKEHQSRLKFFTAVISLAVFVTGPTKAQLRLRNSAVRRPVIELRSIDHLKAAFQRDRGKVRVVVLISPT